MKYVSIDFTPGLPVHNRVWTLGLRDVRLPVWESVIRMKGLLEMVLNENSLS
jgi:hypothetical protein